MKRSVQTNKKNDKLVEKHKLFAKKKALAYARYTLQHYNLFEGATGVIVEEEDMQLYNNEYEKGRWVQVMGPNGLQQWDIRWCTHMDDMDEEDEE